MGSQCALLKDTTRCRQCGSNSGPLDSESDALQLCHRDPNPHINTSLWIQHDEAVGFNSVLNILSPVANDTAQSINDFRLRQVDSVPLKSI